METLETVIKECGCTLTLMLELETRADPANQHWEALKGYLSNLAFRYSDILNHKRKIDNER